MFYAEGKWDFHLDDFATLPERSILYHVDQGDIFLAHKKLHHKFALSGGIPNVLLSYGTPQEVRDEVRRRVDDFAPGGGFIFNTVHNIQADVPPENVVALFDTAYEFGRYPIE